MLSEPVLTLLRDIYVDEKNKEVRMKLRDNPEEVLISLLTEIKQDLPKISTMLSSTVWRGAAGVLEEHAKK